MLAPFWPPELSADNLVTEVGFVVNCHTALRLVEAFDARRPWAEVKPYFACVFALAMWFAGLAVCARDPAPPCTPPASSPGSTPT